MPSATYDKTVASIFDAVLDEQLTPVALKAAAEYVGAAGAAYLLVNKLTSQVSSLARWGCSNGSVRDYLTHYGKIDPFRPIQEKAASGSLARLTERLPQSVLRRDEWYNDYALPAGVCDILGAKLHESPSHLVIVGLYRTVGDANPESWDMASVQALMPSLRSAASLHLGLIDIGYQSAIVRGRLDHLTAGDFHPSKRPDCRDEPGGGAHSAHWGRIDDPQRANLRAPQL